MFDMLDRREASRSVIRRWVKRMSQRQSVTVFFALITIWVLIADDLRLACMPPAADTPMATIAMICMCAFVLEIVMYSLGSRRYLFSFFFWLDVLATASMILDIPAVEYAILGQDGDSESLRSATLARATRMSRIGTKAGRIASVRALNQPSCCCHAVRGMVVARQQTSSSFI
jgi:Ion transport protein